jgi:hypothetical protein
MDPPLTMPTPSYPANYTEKTPKYSNGLSRQDTPNPVTSQRKNNSGSNLQSVGMTRNPSFMSLASLNLANSSSSLIGIFASTLDNDPPSPVATPPLEMRRERAVIEGLDKWVFFRDTVRSISVLFALGYLFAMFLDPSPFESL